jgi:hypothetical protein
VVAAWDAIGLRFLGGGRSHRVAQTTAGPYPILRLPREEWSGFVLAVEREASRRGLRFIDDMNETPADGFFAMPLSPALVGIIAIAMIWWRHAGNNKL